MSKKIVVVQHRSGCMGCLGWIVLLVIGLSIIGYISGGG